MSGVRGSSWRPPEAANNSPNWANNSNNDQILTENKLEFASLDDMRSECDNDSNLTKFQVTKSKRKPSKWSTGGHEDGIEIGQEVEAKYENEKEETQNVSSGKLLLTNNACENDTILKLRSTNNEERSIFSQGYLFNENDRIRVSMKQQQSSLEENDRSLSKTSDYFSSNQNSPILANLKRTPVSNNNNNNNNKLIDIRKVISKKNSRRKEDKSITRIYENPLCNKRDKMSSSARFKNASSSSNKRQMDTNKARWLKQPMGSQTDSQRTTNELNSLDDTHESQTDDSARFYYQPSDFHLYQVVVPEVAPDARPTERPSSLVTDEPLIRPACWQNKTLIDLRRSHPNQHQSPNQLQQSQRQARSTLLRSQPGGGLTQVTNLGPLWPPLASSSIYSTGSSCSANQLNFSAIQKSNCCFVEAPGEPKTGSIFARSNSKQANDLPEFNHNARNLSSSQLKHKNKFNILSSSPSSSSSTFHHPLKKSPILKVLLLLLLSLILFVSFFLFNENLQLNNKKQTSLARNENELVNKDLETKLAPINANELRLNQLFRPNAGGSGAGPPEAGQVAPSRPAPQSIGQAEPAGANILRDNEKQIAIIANEPNKTVIRPTLQKETSEKIFERTQNFWLPGAPSGTPKQKCQQCGQFGECHSGQCLCQAGYSGPSCSQIDCPNFCSHQGNCQMSDKSPIEFHSKPANSVGSISFQTLTSTLAQNSYCPIPSLNQSDQSADLTMALIKLKLFDNRLIWKCNCEPGFTGSDCSKSQEFQCDDEVDNDNDGLIDCEDDDCCNSSVCKDNLMCFKSSEPNLALRNYQYQQLKLDYFNASTSTTFKTSSFFDKLQFLIANESVQSYAQIQAFDQNRVALIRGRAVKWSANKDKLAQQDEGIVSVRVSVAESAQFGFTLTRTSGQFDILVNGDDWVTLQFHRNAFVPLKRRVFVRSHSFHVLENEVELRPSSALVLSSVPPTGPTSGSSVPASSGSSSGSGSGSGPAGEPPSSVQLDRPFGLNFLLQFSADFSAKSQEKRQTSLLACLANTKPASWLPQLTHFEPKIISHNSEANASWLVFASSGAFSVRLPVKEPLELVYNSASFEPASSIVKPSVSIELVGPNFKYLERLKTVVLHLDIEGQSRMERLAPKAGLIYTFAWNRRNIYEQKVYGFSELTIRVGYEWTQPVAFDSQAYCFEHQSGSTSASASASGAPRPTGVKQIVWFQRKLQLQAHPLGQLADAGKWALLQANRLDSDKQVVYFSSGWALPVSLVYPPTISEAISLGPTNLGPTAHRPEERHHHSHHQIRRLISRGPHSSVFMIVGLWKKSARLIQLDSLGKRRLLDIPLNILTSKFGHQSSQMDEPHAPIPSAEHQAPPLTSADSTEDLQILYNNYLSTLYVSSKLSGKIVSINYSSLLVLNKTIGGGQATAAAEDEIDIEPTTGFGRLYFTEELPVRSASSVRLLGPHSMSLDEKRQILYFIDGPTNLIAFDLNRNSLVYLQAYANLMLSSASGNQEQRQSDNFYAFSSHNESSQNKTKTKCSNSLVGLNEFKPKRLQNLAWSQSDLSLYFIDSDENVLYALRPNLLVELVAAGSVNSHRLHHQHKSVQLPLPAECVADAQGAQLGLIESLSIDLNELLIVHRWMAGSESRSTSSTSTTSSTSNFAQVRRQTNIDRNNESKEVKINGHYYLAKLNLGIQSEWEINKSRLISKVIDLHSASSTWDPLIWATFKSQMPQAHQLNTNTHHLNQAKQINWTRLMQPNGRWSSRASSSNLDFAASASAHASGSTFGLANLPSKETLKAKQMDLFDKIPFIHLSDGFKRIDSIEFNSDGSIFVLDLGSNSIKLIQPYSLTNFNLINRFDLTIRRLFDKRGASVDNQHPVEATIFDSQQQQQQQQQEPLQVVIVDNPIENELMQFHHPSGLHLSSFKSSTENEQDENYFELYYRIFNNDKLSKLDEDDENDFYIKKLIHKSLTTIYNDQQQQQQNYLNVDKSIQYFHSDKAHIRLNKIIDQFNNEYEFVRFYTGSRFVLQSILLNQQSICEMTTDQIGALSSYNEKQQTSWFELVYDENSYLLQTIISKYNTNLTNNNPLESMDQKQSNNKNQLTRIVYDRIFKHYCGLFVVNV